VTVALELRRPVANVFSSGSPAPPTIFIWRYPVVPLKDKRATPRDSDDATPPVLIVEDDAAIRQALMDAVRDEGYRVETATNGLEAIEKLRWGLRPCLIILDMQMRLMTGWEFRAEQTKDPALSKIPVVAMTAGRWKDVDLKDFVARIDKPIALDDLRALLRDHCQITGNAAAETEV
jgi:CheY-like chemotaxis protein